MTLKQVTSTVFPKCPIKVCFEEETLSGFQYWDNWAYAVWGRTTMDPPTETQSSWNKNEGLGVVAEIQ